MRNKLSLIILLCFFAVACSNDRLDVDVTDIDVSIGFDRFEKSMFDGKSIADMRSINQDLINRGGELYEFYVYDMLRSGSVYDDSISNYLWKFVNDSIMKIVNSDIENEFSDFSEVENTLVDGFKHLKYHLSNSSIPNKIITYNAAYSFGVTSTDSVIGIGLEMYLGPENRIVQEIRFPLYVKEKMKRQYLPVDVAHSWLVRNVIDIDQGETFLSSLIYYGKLRYVIEAMFPALEANTIMRYNKEEYDFARASEYNVWQYLVDMNWVYTTDVKVKLRFFEEAPTTVGIEESPGRLGQFMGWQMVRSYMDANKEVTLHQLLTENNEIKILKAYKPEENE